MDTRFRIKTGCLRLGISQSKIAAKLGVTRQEIAHVTAGRYKSGKVVEGVAAALECTPAWLVSGDGPGPTWLAETAKTWPHTWAKTDDPSGDYLLPVIGSAAAATGARVDGDEEGGSVPIKAHWQGIVIRGTSGEPVVLDGQTVMVDPLLKAGKNRLVVVHTDNGPVLKRFVNESGGKIFLASINHGWDSLVVDSTDLPHLPLVVVGVVFTDGVAK